MGYYPDLSPHSITRLSSPNVLNVGWLDASHSYHKGKVEDGLIDKLVSLCAFGCVNRTRGWHACPFCSIYPVTVKIDNEIISLGSAEIRIASRGDIIFAAPNLICHYIAAHEYCPPDEFLTAVAGYY